MYVDTSAAPRRPDPERASQWLSGQRVFISSPMADAAAERRAVAQAVRDAGAEVVWFEEIGRDAAAEEAYLTGVDSSTIYIGILNQVYGRQDSTGWSATEAEYGRARERGLRLAVYTAADAPHREGHLQRFIERIRGFLVTENYQNPQDLADRVQRRLHELAAEAVSPWVKVGAFVFRADFIDDAGDLLVLRARLSEDIAHAFEEIRDRPWGRDRLRVTLPSRVAEGELQTVRRTTGAGGSSKFELTFGRMEPARPNPMRSSAGGLTSGQLVEAGMRSLFLGSPLPESIAGTLGFLGDTGIDRSDLLEAFRLPNEIAPAVTRLLVVDGLIGGGHASRVVEVSVGPRGGDIRRVAIEWIDTQAYHGVEPDRYRVEGEWRAA